MEEKITPNGSDVVAHSKNGLIEPIGNGTKKQEDGVKKRHGRCSRWIKASQSVFGVVLCILCALAYATNSFLAKLLMERNTTTPYFVSFSRSAFIFVFIVPITYSSQTKLANSLALNKHWKAVAIRCIFGCGSVVYFIGLYFAPLADIGVIFTSGLPIFSAVLARIFLKEAFRYTDIVFIIAVAAGVMLILRPPYIFPVEVAEAGVNETSMKHRLIGGSCALLASFCQSVSLMGTRSCAGEVHYSALVFWNGLVGLCVNLGIMLGLESFVSPCLSLERTLIVTAAVSGMVAQATATLAVRYISPVIASLSASAELAILFIFQTSILGHPPHAFSVIGSAVIIGAMVLLVGRSWLSDKVTQNKNVEKSVFYEKSSYHKMFRLLIN